MTSRPLVRAVGLAKVYTKRRGLLGTKKELIHALSGVTFEIAPGETLGVVGESGSGKTTLGRTVLRLIEPTYGHIFVGGRDVTKARGAELFALRKRLQIVFQDPNTSLNPRLSIESVIAEGLELHGLARGAEVREKVGALLQQVGLARELADRYPAELSGGQRQRVAIARALAVEPELIVCDEVTSALDVSVQAQILNLLLDIQAEKKMSYLFISHDLAVVELMSHRIMVLYLGRVIEIAPTAALIKRRLHPYTRALFEASPSLPSRDDTAPRRRRLAISGQPPSPAAPPPGCHFHPRCPRAEAGKCDVETPQLSPVRADPSHQVACFFPTEAIEG